MKLNTLFLVLWTLILLGILLSPMNWGIIPEIRNFRYFDKVAHFGLFAITGLVSVYGANFLSAFRYRLLFGLVFGLVLAFGTDIGQSLIPSRTMSLYDIAADLVGLFFSLIIYTLVYCWKKKL